MTLEQTDDMIAIMDTDGILTYVNPAFERATGYSPDEVIGGPPGIFGEGPQSEEFDRELWAMVRGGSTWRGKLSGYRKDGTLFTTDTTTTPVFSESQEPLGFVQVARDVTAQIALEASLAEAQRLEAIGWLAGSIAHDFNNILTVVMGSAALIEVDESDETDNVSSLAREILEASMRGADLVRQLLAFSRRQALGSGSFDVASAVAEYSAMLGRMFGGPVQLSTRVGEAIPQVGMDRSQFDQILTNLIINARDAMADGGQVTVSVSRIAVDTARQVQGWTMDPGEYAYLHVSDTGGGMSPETASKIFEPFFTTKDVGRGTGLGLSTVHGIVTQAGGLIEVVSELGEGTTFTVYLPAAQQEAHAEPAD